MTALLLLVAVPVVLLVALAAAADRLLPSARPGPTDDATPTLRGAWGIAERARTLGIAGAAGVVVLAVVLAGRGGGVTLVVAPALAGLVCLAAVDVGQRTIWRRLAGGGAAVETRRAVDYVPRVTTPAVALGVVALVPLLVGAFLFSGRDGRRVEWECATGGGSHSFLGSHYAGPLVVLCGLLVLGAVAGVGRVVRRPRNGADPAVVAVDDAIRRRAAVTTTACAGLGVGGSVAALAATDRMVLLDVAAQATGVAGCEPLVGGAWATALGGVALLGAALALWCLALVLRPTRDAAPLAVSPGPVVA